MFSLNVRDQVSHPYRIGIATIVLKIRKGFNVLDNLNGQLKSICTSVVLYYFRLVRGIAYPKHLREYVMP
jgi:hypothetical protein